MLKPSDKWKWYFCEREGHMMLDLGDEMIFRTNLTKNLLVTCAFEPCQFTVDDASDYQVYSDSVANLPLSEPRKVEFVLNCVAAKRFHKPVQPKSWYFDPQGLNITPTDGEQVSLTNSFNRGDFVVLEVGENASLCAYVEVEPFYLSENKLLEFGQAIKVMHDRMSAPLVSYITIPHYSMVG